MPNNHSAFIRIIVAYPIELARPSTDAVLLRLLAIAMMDVAGTSSRLCCLVPRHLAAASAKHAHNACTASQWS